ncbi:mannan polymerase II complex ANP1 subunit [Colletotrichum lupini]|uniref:Mannan polymerase II complex ANP1 subunit n=2 Tax=Colletotrichum acutatum species complex TaxID=2707335 RepID=A0A9Q8SF20_9PEZI|nr:mannan polymerase II complex ANP1 subunit [Colletotrichum lupini]XP_060381769.1 mannan polymerase II complex ANP1 subunit [Colletotrichum tamarilloi]KAK1498056.1 mannan polymerase II complex ANP1 subunit [Colletotrichum tamarilloi]UQC75883.1 mannan polymerase II complex ANP1 subunit [Colletotrichum lupini]
MLPSYSSSASKVVPRHHASGYSNGYPRGNTFEISPHRYQPRASTPANRRRQRLVTRLIIVAVVAIFFLVFVWPGASLTSIFSLGLLSASSDLQLETVRYYDLSNVQGTARGWEREERILLCVPLRDAESHLSMFASHLRNFTYPHHLIDLAFLVSDSKDRTLQVLNDMLEEIQADEDPKQPYGEISIIEKDFGQKVNQDVESRHGFAAQASRRKLMAQARNWLLSAALRPYHSWVYWRDVDVETAPFTILEDLMRHNKDVIVPNVWRPLPDWLGGEQPYDLNSWQESETALALADTLDEDAVIVEGYAEYATWRPHLAYLRDPYGDPDMEMEIDGVGGVSILAKAKVFRSGVHFPAFSFEKHAETEGFGKMAKRMEYSVVGLPHYTIWHLYEPSVDDIKHMEEMEQERLASQKEEEEKAEKAKKVKEQFGDASSQWEKDKTDMQNLVVGEKKKETKGTKEDTKEVAKEGKEAKSPKDPDSNQADTNKKAAAADKKDTEGKSDKLAKKEKDGNGAAFAKKAES